MASKSVKILIEADNQASKKLKDVQEQVERNVKGIQNAGQKAKISTELVGSFAAAFGGSEVASFAGEIAQMSDRVREFGEVGKQSEFAALAFKAALVGGVAVVAAKIGMAIGNIVFETEKWNRQLEKAVELSDKLAASTLTSNTSMFDREIEQIELIRDPKKQEDELASLFAMTSRNVAGTEGKIKRLRKETEEWADAWQITGERKAMAAMAEQELKQAEALLEVQTKQREELRERLSPIQKEFEERKKLIALQESSDQYLENLRDELELLRASKEEAIAIQAARNTEGPAASAEAERLLSERDQILQNKKATEDAEKAKADAAKKAADERIKAAEKVANAEMGALQNLQKQVIELTRGKQAGREFALQLQGIDKETASRIATAEAKLARLLELQNDAGGDAVGQITAVQSRLLSRGSGNDVAERDKEAKRLRAQQETKKATESVRDAVKDLQTVIENNQTESAEPLTLTVVS